MLNIRGVSGMNYVNDLYDALSEVAPVLGVLDKRPHGGEIVVSYSEEPTAEQKQAVDEIVEDWPLKETQLDEKGKLDDTVRAIESRGYDTGRGFIIDLSSKGSSDLTGSVVLAKEAQTNGYEGDHYILDIEGITHAVTFEELIQIGIEYGAARNALYIAASQKSLVIRGAKTVEEVRSVNTEDLSWQE